VVLGPEEVDVVRRHDGEPELVGEAEDPLVQLVLPLRVVGLDLEIVAVAEDLGVPRGRRPGLVPPVRHEVLRHLAREAGRGHDHPFGVPLQHLPVDAGAMVEPLHVPDGGQLDEVPVALEVACEEHEMVVRPLPPRRAPVPPVARRDVRLHPEDRLDPGLARHLLELPRAEHAAVVGERDGGHLELLRPPHQVAEAVGAVEEGVLAVRVEMDERHGLRPRTRTNPGSSRAGACIRTSTSRARRATRPGGTSGPGRGRGRSA